jgi:molybdopterin-guanine dinucleotide biosynthesis protein
MATVGANTVAQCIDQAVAFLAQADREFDAGDRRQGSEKLYGAATQVVIAAAKQRGWQYRSHRATKNAVIRLESEYQDPLLIAGFLAAEKFHKNFFHDEMEDYEIVADRPIVHRFVDRLVTLVNDYAPDA